MPNTLSPFSSALAIALISNSSYFKSLCLYSSSSSSSNMYSSIPCWLFVSALVKGFDDELAFIAPFVPFSSILSRVLTISLLSISPSSPVSMTLSIEDSRLSTP